MNKVSIIGLDLAKNVFQAHGAEADGSVLLRRKPCKHPPRAVWLFSGLSVYRVSLWTHTKTPTAFKFCQFLILAAVAVGRMTRKLGSLRKAIATA